MRLSRMLFLLSAILAAALIYQTQRLSSRDTDCTPTGSSRLLWHLNNGKNMQLGFADGAPHWVCALTLPARQMPPVYFELRELGTAKRIPWDCWFLFPETLQARTH